MNHQNRVVYEMRCRVVFGQCIANAAAAAPPRCPRVVTAAGGEYGAAERAVREYGYERLPALIKL